MATKTPTRPAQRGDLLDGLDVLRADHLTVEKIFQRLERLPKPSPTRASLIRKLVKDLSVHATIEEEILYPVLRTEIEGGAPLANHALDEHHEVKEALVDLQRLKPDGEDFDTVLLALMEDVREHVAEEEGELFPKLERVLDDQRRHDLAIALSQAKKLAPTRPHPAAPDTPPGNIAAGLPMAAIDRAKDLGVGVMHFGLGVAKTALDAGLKAATSAMRRIRR